MSVYFSNTGFYAKVAIYSDSTGAPSALIAQGKTQLVTTTGWNSFAISAKLSAGCYWLCVVTSGTSARAVMTSTSSNTHAWTTASYYYDYPSSFGTPTAYEKAATSIYATYTPTSSNTPPTASTTLHVEGTKLKDSNGNTITLRGVDDSITTWYDAGVGYNDAQFAYMADWGCNAVRFTVSDWDFGYTAGNLGVYSSSTFWTRLDSQVNAALANGLTPIICGFSTMGNSPDGVYSGNVANFMSKYHTWNDYIKIYSMLAQRYADRGVIYEMINEPLYCNLATYQTQMEATVDAIRTYDANAIVIVQAVGTADWDTQNLQFIQSYPIRRSNIVYTAHIYSWQITSNTESAIRGKLSSGYYNLYAAQAIASGYPVIFTEFGCGGNGVDYEVHSMNSWSDTWLNNFMSVCDKDGYSGYTAWRWCTSSYDEPWNLLADWNGNPSTYGHVIKEYFTNNH